ncbi:hypothetical protein MMC12_002741 [Toensbergia leucococca]|nr:hypothetical protein [Toensbergia leucococca]
MTESSAQQTSPTTSIDPAPPKDERPAVLIIGGLGYVGRFLALHLYRNNLASEVRLVDKVLPQLAWLAPEFAEACSQDKFMQADATREQSLPKIFNRTNGLEFDYVFNCGGETRYSQDDSVYRARSLDLSLTLGRECARRRTPALVEFSTGMVYKPPSSSTINSGGCTETASTKPWTKIAKWKLAAEEGLEKIAKREGLRYVVLRLAHVYGEYDVGFLARGLCLARVYEKLDSEMKWLWTKDLRVNTVHVHDVCEIAWRSAKWCASPASTTETGAGRVFNVVDRGDTSQGTLATLFSSTFNISTGFQGTLISSFARFNLDSVVDDVNEEVLQPWADLLKEKEIVRPGPLSPFLEKELLRDCDLCLKGERAERVLGWKVGVVGLGGEGIRGVVDSYGRMGWWP